jgi:hypothetical protein
MVFQPPISKGGQEGGLVFYTNPQITVKYTFYF